MQVLEPRLDFGSIATNPTESVRPDLWPDYAYVPSIGIQGGTLRNVAGYGLDGTMNGATWTNNGGIECSGGDVIIPRLPLIGTGPFWFLGHFQQTNTSVVNSVFRPRYSDLNGDFGMYCGVGTTVYIRDAATSQVTVQALADDTARNCVAACRDRSGYMHMWANGAYIGKSGAVADININGYIDANFTIGSYQGYMHYFNGYIWNVQIGIGRDLSVEQGIAITADPLLPFRRAPQVSYFVAAAGLAIPIILNQARRRRT